MPTVVITDWTFPDLSIEEGIFNAHGIRCVARPCKTEADLSALCAEFTWRVGSWMFDDGTQPTRHGAAFIVIDPNAIMPAAQFAARMEALIDEIHAAPLADGAARLRVPGEIEWERHAQALRAGIVLPEDVVASLRKAAEMTGISAEWLR